MFLDIFALIVMGILLATVIGFVVFLGPLPGKIAAERGHRQADAIKALGWIGLITMGAAWLVALVWAYTAPISMREPGVDLENRVADLERQLAGLTEKGADA